MATVTCIIEIRQSEKFLAPPYRGTSLTRNRLPVGPHRKVCLGPYGDTRGVAISHE